MPQEMCFKAANTSLPRNTITMRSVAAPAMNVGTEIEVKRRSDEQQDSRKNNRDPDDHASAAERRHMRTHLCRFTKMPRAATIAGWRKSPRWKPMTAVRS